jgi:hypothetical protein
MAKDGGSEPNGRQVAQQRLSEAQDRWLHVLERHKGNRRHEVVLAARAELEFARKAYMRLLGEQDRS